MMQSTDFKKLASELIARKARTIEQIKFKPWNLDFINKEIESLVLPVLIEKVREEIEQTTQTVIKNLEKDGFSLEQFRKRKYQLHEEIKKANRLVASKPDFGCKDFLALNSLDQKVDIFQDLYSKTYEVCLDNNLIDSCAGQLFDIKVKVQKPEFKDQKIKIPQPIKKSQQQEKKVKGDDKIIRLSRESNLVHVYNLGTNRYSRFQIKDFNFPQKFASYIYAGQIYFSGGYQMIDNLLNGVFKLKYDQNTFRPILVGQMLRQRFEHCMIVRNERQIYNLGGCKGANKSLSRCEVLQEKKSKELPPMIQSRRCFAACIFKGTQIYVFCGKKQDRLLTSIEKLDLEPDNMKWKKIELKQSDDWVPRGWISATAINDEDILIYGHQNSSKLNFFFPPNQTQVYKFKSEIVPETSGYWCPAVVNKEQELYVFSYQQQDIKLFKFWNKHWEKLTLN